MKNKFKFFLTIGLLFSSILMSCNSNDPQIHGQDNESGEGNENNDPNNDDDEKDPPIKEEKFEIKTSTYGLFLENDQGTYIVSNANKDTDDDFNFPLEIIMEVNDDDWDWVSLLRNTKIEVENEKIVPINAIEVEEVRNSDLVGSSGTNAIEQIKLNFDRKLLNVGKTKIRFQTTANNGNANGSESIICFEMEIKEYGSIDAGKIQDVTLNFKIEPLIEEIKSKINGNIDYFQELLIWVGYQDSKQVTFGSNAFLFDRKSFLASEDNQDLNLILKDFSFTNMKFDDDVTYVIRGVLTYKSIFNYNENFRLETTFTNNDISSCYKNGDNVLKINADTLTSDVNFKFVNK